MSQKQSLKPIKGANRLRSRLSLQGEFDKSVGTDSDGACCTWFGGGTQQPAPSIRILAGSAFLIYLDPQHGTNTTRTLLISQMMAATIGWVMYLILGPGYLSGGIAMVATIALMILLDVVHSPAIAISLNFAFRAENKRT